MVMPLMSYGLYARHSLFPTVISPVFFSVVVVVSVTFSSFFYDRPSGALFLSVYHSCHPTLLHFFYFVINYQN